MQHALSLFFVKSLNSIKNLRPQSAPMGLESTTSRDLNDTYRREQNFTHQNSKAHYHYNDYYHDSLEAEGLSSGSGRGGVTYFRFGDVFCYPLGTIYDDFQEKICMDISCGNCQTFYCSYVIHSFYDCKYGGKALGPNIFATIDQMST